MKHLHTKFTAIFTTLALLLPLLLIPPVSAADGPVTVSDLAELQTAIDSATGDTTITLTKRITITANDGDDGDVSLDGTGKNITILRGEGATGHLFSVNTGGSLTLKNITLDGNNGVVTNAGGSLVSVSGGTFTMLDGAVLQNNSCSGSAGGVYVSGNGTFTMTGGKIINNTSSVSSRGGGVYMFSGTFTLGGKAVIKDNLSVGKVSNVYLYSGEYITLGTGADAPTDDMEVWVQTVTANGVIVNSDATSGSEKFFKSDISSREIIHNNGQLILKGKTGDLWGEFQNDILAYATATEDMTITVSGALTADCIITIPAPQTTGITLTIEGKNDAVITRGEGVTGNLFTVESGSLTLTNITIDGNKDVVTATSPLVAVSGGELIMEDGAVLQNNKSNDGGGVTVNSGGKFTMNGGEIKGNEATGTNFGGGGVCVVGGAFTMNGGDISDNTTTNGGGGVSVFDSGASFTMTGGAISGNTASGGGGVRISSGCTFTMTGGEIIGNKATNADLRGGGVYVNGGTFKLGGAAVIKGNTFNEQDNNVLLPSSNYITLGTGDDAPAAGMEVWVTKSADSGVIVQSGASPEHVGYFFADDSTKGVKLVGSQLKLLPLIAGTVAVSGTAKYGHVLTATPNITSSKPGGLSYQWLRDGVAIVGATSSTYTLVLADIGTTITVEVTAANYGGRLISTPTEPVAKATLTPSIGLTGVTGKVYDGTTAVSGTPTIVLTGAVGEETPTATATFAFDSADVGDNKTVTATGITLTSLSDRYELELDELSVASGVSITQKPITVTMTVDNKPYDGDTTATVSGYTFDGVLNNDDVTLTGGTATFASSGVGNSIEVTFAGYTLGGADAGNYSLTQQPASVTANITKKDVSGSISFADGEATYSGAELEYKEAKYNNSGNNFTYSYAVSTETPNTGSLDEVSNKPLTVGKYTVTATYEDENYKGSATVNFTVNPKPITVEVTIADKPYDGNETATISDYTFDSVIEGDIVTLTGGTATFASFDVKEGITVNFAGYTLGGADAGNYTLTGQPASVTANITKGSGLTSVTTTLLNISVSDTDEHEFDLLTMLNKTDYGNISYAKGTLTGDTGILSKAELIGSKLTYQVSGTTTGTATQQVTITTDNYEDVTVSITFTVTDKTDVNGSISFGDGEATYSGAELEYKEATCTVTGGTITYTYAVSTETPNARLGVNGKPFTVGKYTVTATYEDDDSIGSKTVNFTVNPKPITVNVTIANKAYDGTYAATISSLSLVDVEGDDDVDVTPTAATFTSLNVGTNIPVTLGIFTLTGDDAFNYTLTQPTGVKANITQQGNTPVYGDVDGKDGVTQVDVIALKRWLARWSVIIVDINADVNGDGSINDIDVVILKRYLAGWNIKLGK